jgi:hypothetical protein
VLLALLLSGGCARPPASPRPALSVPAPLAVAERPAASRADLFDHAMPEARLAIWIDVERGEKDR